MSPSDPPRPALPSSSRRPPSAVRRRSSVGQSVSVVRSGRRAQQQPPDSSRPGSAGSGADSPALVTTTLVTAPYITVTGTVQTRPVQTRPDPRADPTRPVQTRPDVCGPDPTRSVQTQPVYHRHSWGIPRQIDQKNLEITPHISDFDYALHIGLSWSLILVVRISAPSIESISRYGLGQFFIHVQNFNIHLAFFSSWFIEFI